MENRKKHLPESMRDGKVLEIQNLNPNFISDKCEESKVTNDPQINRKDIGVALGKSGYIGQPDYWGTDGKGRRVKRQPY